MLLGRYFNKFVNYLKTSIFWIFQMFLTSPLIYLLDAIFFDCRVQKCQDAEGLFSKYEIVSVHGLPKSQALFGLTIDVIIFSLQKIQVCEF